MKDITPAMRFGGFLLNMVFIGYAALAVVVLVRCIFGI